MKNKYLIKILGFGSVVKHFLKMKRNTFPEITFEIYRRSNQGHHPFLKNILFKNISSFSPDDSPTFCCCSMNEEKLLRTSADQSRLSVALSNLELILTFIHAGFFNSGTHFILTNPSDLIAEFIIRKTKNKNVYGLGASADRRRYNKILSEAHIDPIEDPFDLIGNHWDSPFINFSTDSIYNNVDFIKELIQKLKSKIKAEFSGYKPPIASGAQVMYDAIFGLYNHAKLEVSAFTKDQDAVSCGTLDSVTYEFNQPSHNPVTNSLLQEAIQFHKETYNNLIGKVS